MKNNKREKQRKKKIQKGERKDWARCRRESTEKIIYT